MTTPSDSFDYTDDSVIARVSIDVPSQAITDIGQLSTSMGAMRTQLEAISRAQGDWLDYLQQVPVIAERANQAYRDQITQLERISYIQNELGGSGGGGGGAGNVSPQTPMRSAGGGAGYSTAAPAGFRDDFAGKTAGMGGNRGAASAADFSGQLEALANEDPRMMPNAASARGLAINPSLAGFLGGAAGVYFGHDNGGIQGKGQDAPGRESSQPQTGRTADGHPDVNQSGAPVGSEPQRHPATPGPDSTGFEQMRDSMWTEFKKGIGGTRVGQILGSMAPGLIGKMWGGGGGGTDESVAGTQLSFPGMPTPGGGAGGGGLGGLLGGMGGMSTKAKLGMAGAALGLGVAGYGAVQNIGERVTRFQALGSEEGGDYATGAKEELHARMLGLDPFITTEDARKAIQIPMSEGFKGESRDEIRDFLIQNFKELGVSMAQSAAIEFSSLKGSGTLSDESVLKTRSGNEATMNVMKELAGEGGMSQSQRINQLEQLMKSLTASGGSPESIRRSALQWQEGFGNDSMALREQGSQIISGAMRSGNLMMMAGQRLGVTGIVPEAMEATLTDMGYSETEITELIAREAAGYLSGVPGGRKNRVGMFLRYMRQEGIEMDFPAASALYDKVTGGKSPSERANEIIQRQAGKGSGGQPSGGGRGNKEDANWAEHHQGYDPSENAERVEDEFAAARQQRDLYAPAGRNARPLPQSAAQVQRQTIDTRGSVTGEVRITVDQAGRVTAPPVIQLTGNQRAVNAGMGSAQLNNAPASEPRGTAPLVGGR